MIGILALLLTLALAIPVSAHAAYKSSIPPANGTVQQAPSQVLITFSEETDPLKSGGSVTDASGATVSTGFEVDLNQRTNMAIDLKPNLSGGVYTVTWNTFTDDDSGVGNGTFTFTIQAAAGTGTAMTSAATATGTHATASSSPAAATTPTSIPAPTAAPTATTAATVAATATRPASSVVATGTGGGTTTTAPTTLPQTGESASGTLLPWVILVIIVGGGAIVAGSLLRHRIRRS